MAYTTTSNVAGFIPNFYSKVFLERLNPGPKMMDLCIKKPLPEGNGTVAYFPRMANDSTMVSAYKLTEGTIVTPDLVDDAQISATIEQYGRAAGVTDLTQMTAINGTVEEAVKQLADQANNIVDKRIMQEAYGTSATPTGAGFSCFAYNTVGGVDLGASTSAFGTYVGSVEYRLKASTIRAAVSKLQARNVQPMDDGYYALVVSSTSFARLQADSEWQTAYQYTDPENIRKGVAGRYAGAKLIMDNNIKTSANGSNGDTLYYNILLGHGGLGATELTSGVKPYFNGGGSSKFDPIDQVIVIGWKANFVPVRLNLSCGIIVVTSD